MRAFIAIDIESDPRISNLINGLKRQGVRVKAVEEENIHLTLKFLGEIDDSQIQTIENGLKSLENYPVFSIYLKGVGAFPSNMRPRTVWVGLEYPEILKEIWDVVEEISEKAGISREKRGFSPHITIGRVKDSRNSWKLKRFIEEHENYEIGKRMVKEIKLKKSVLTEKGPIYSDIASVRLKG